MTITSPHQVDLYELASRLPRSVYALRAFTRRAKIVIKEDPRAVASVRLTKEGVQIQISPENFDRVVKTYDDFAFVLFHEYLHVLSGHQDWARLQTFFSFAYKKFEDMPPHEVSLMKYANELEIKHLEHILLPDPVFHEVNRRLYADSPHPNYRIFYRETPQEEIEDPHYRHLHRRIFSEGRYSTREAYFLLKEKFEHEQEQDSFAGGAGDSEGTGSAASPDPGDGGGDPVEGGDDAPKAQDDSADDEQDGGEGGSSPSDSEEDAGDQKGDASGEGEEEREDAGSSGEEGEEAEEDGGGESGDEGEEDEGEASEGEEGDGGEGGGHDVDDEGGDAGDEGMGEEEGKEEEEEEPLLVDSESGIDEGAPESLVEEFFEAFGQAIREAEAGGGQSDQAVITQTVKERVRVQKDRQLERSLRKAAAMPSFYSRINSKVALQAARAVRRSVVPNFVTDRHAMKAFVAGNYVAKYRRRRSPNEEKFGLYYDISGSQDPYIPACNEIVMHNREHLAEHALHLFGGFTHHVTIRDFTKAAREGRVQNLASNRGTNFDRVAEDIKERGYRKVVILTDNYCSLSEDYYPMFMRRDFYLLLVLTEDPATMYGDYGKKGFIPVAKDIVVIEAINQLEEI